MKFYSTLAILLLPLIRVQAQTEINPASIMKESDLIYEDLKIYSSATLNKQYYATTKALKQLKEAPNEENKKIVLENFNQLKALHSFYYDLEDKKQSWGNTYFSLWERAFYLKGKIDKKYKREELSKNSYGSSQNETVTRVYKKEIYYAGESVINDYFYQLKSLPECDYYARMKVTEELIDFLNKMDKLYSASNTRDLQKGLRREDSVDRQKEMILNFPL